MSWMQNCVGTARSGEHYFLLKADALDLGPQDSMPAGEYAARLALARQTKMEWPAGEVTADARLMFTSPEHHKVFNDGELYAYAVHIGETGLLDEVAEGGYIVAYEDTATHAGVANPYMVAPPEAAA